MLIPALLTSLTLVAVPNSPLPPGWQAVRGDGWRTAIDLRVLLAQTSHRGSAVALSESVRGTGGAWRCLVQPSLGANACGMWFQASRDLAKGLRCELGGNPGVGGFALKDAGGNVLWEDRYAPWQFYNAYVLEGVVEKGRVRVQVFHYDGKTLISQSDWLEARTAQVGNLATYTQDGAARFWGAELAEVPLSPITDDAPNRRRLVSSADSPWALFGEGNWMWTDGRKARVRQYAKAERAWALNRSIRGTDRVWTCSVRTYAGTGGAGMLFRCDEQCKGGFNCWLGGSHGAGSLMLYHNAGPGGRGKALWSSKQDKWHYDEDLMLRAETRGGKVRVELFKSDDKGLLARSPWKDVPAAEQAREGYLGCHTWRGSVEFWAFSEGTQAAPVPTKPRERSPLGPEWAIVGDGQWQWAGSQKTALRQTSGTATTSIVHTGIRGARGSWRCTVRTDTETRCAGLLFQVDAKLREGFLCLLRPGRLSLHDLSQQTEQTHQLKVSWESTSCEWQPGGSYVLEGLVVTDRVAVRLLSSDGKTAICESPEVYVSDRNNERRGHIGLTTRAGPGMFSSWSFTPEH